MKQLSQPQLLSIPVVDDRLRHQLAGGRSLPFEVASDRLRERRAWQCPPYQHEGNQQHITDVHSASPSGAVRHRGHLASRSG